MKNRLFFIVVYALLQIGQLQAQFKNGGIIVEQNNGQGLLAAPKDLSSWMAYNESIVACSEYVLNGFDDWRLPTKNELILLYENKNKIGGFLNEFGAVYWSSTSDGRNNYAWYIDFFDGEKDFGNHSYGRGPVRCVRTFNSNEKDIVINNTQFQDNVIDSNDLAFIKQLRMVNSEITDFSSVTGIYKDPRPMGDGDNLDFTFCIINKNGVGLWATGTDLRDAFSILHIPYEPRKVKIGTKVKLEYSHIHRFTCSFSGEQIIFKDAILGTDNWLLEKGSHTLRWVGGIYPGGQIKKQGARTFVYLGPCE
jgi:hypothetical protein